MTAFDLKNQFFHVKLHPAACQFFGFAIQSDTGGTEFFQFNVLPYGFKPAVAIVTKLLLPVKAFLHRFGIRLTLYIDDGRILGKTVQETGGGRRDLNSNLHAQQKSLALPYALIIIQISSPQLCSAVSIRARLPPGVACVYDCRNRVLRAFPNMKTAGWLDCLSHTHTTQH